MFGKKKNNNQNTFKSPPKNAVKKEKVQKEKSESKPISFSKITTPFNKFFQNETNTQATGAVLLFVAVYLAFSFVSYFFSWEADQDKVQNWSTTGIEVFNEQYDYSSEPQNKMGSLGAKIAHFFVFNGFGIAAFGIPFLLFLAGMQLTFKKTLLPFKRSFTVTVQLMLWSSVFLGWAFSFSKFNYGGAFGNQINLWLGHLAGGLGIIIVLLFSAFAITRFTFNLKIENWIGNLANNSSGSKESSTTGGENIFNQAKSFTTIRPEQESDLKTEYGEIPEPVLKTIIPDPEPEPEPELEVETNFTTETPEDEVEKTNSVSAQEQTIDELNAANTIEEEQIIDIKSPSQLDVTTEEATPKVTFEVHTPKEEGLADSYVTQEAPDFEIETPPEEEVYDENKINDLVAEHGEYDPTLDLGRYQFPVIDLLNKYDAGQKKTIDPQMLEDNKKKIEDTLNNYKIEISKITATIGPTITLYEIVPAPGVRIAKIKNLEDDIALSLAALGIRIIAPIPGKGTIGIEVPNPDPDIVSMHTAISSKAFQEAKMELPLALGKTITNETFTIDLAKMPHLLMAGATGQGKSVGLNAILVSLLYRKHPSELKLVLVDPKKVELTLFNKLVRHFLAKLPDEEEAIITDTQKVVKTVNSLCVEMDDRYELLKNAYCRNIKEYNKKFKNRKLNPENGHRFLPYIVLVIDEFADLIMTAGKEIETPIARLAQLARAIGIHLIVATQRPSVNIITGTIKANFPCRIAFRVTSKIDSRTILDAGGADQLIGRGDMLLSTGNELVRIQCAFVDTPEVEDICEFIGEQNGYADAYALPEVEDPNGDAGGSEMMDTDDRDDKFEEAAKIIVLHQQGSASLLQRKLKLGYNRAGRLIDQLEAAGIVGPFEGSKARKVLVVDENSLEQKLIDLAIKSNN